MKLPPVQYVDKNYWRKRGWHPPTPGMIEARRRDHDAGLCATDALSLRTRARRIENDEFDEIAYKVQQLHDYVDSAKRFPAVGMAEPQLLNSKALQVFSAALGMRTSSDSKNDVRVLINPRVTPIGIEKETATENCCSARWVICKVTRYSAVNVEAITLQGEEISTRVEGWSARILQHEYDHLQGILCADRALEQGHRLLFGPPELGDARRAFHEAETLWPLEYSPDQWLATISGKFSLARYL